MPSSLRRDVEKLQKLMKASKEDWRCLVLDPKEYFTEDRADSFTVVIETYDEID